MAQPTSFEASLNYLSDTNQYKDEKAYEIWLDDVPAGLPATNVEFKLYPGITIRDVRSAGLDGFSIEEHGFQYYRHPFPKHCPISTAESEMSTDAQRQAILDYIEVMNTFICSRLGGEKAVCFDFRIRRSKGTPMPIKPRMYTLSEDVDARKMTIEVAHAIHADGSPNGVQKSLACLLDDEEKADLESGSYRFRIINIWRPLISRINDNALAVCDRRTTFDSDWETVEKVQPQWIEESMYPRWNDKHEWFCLKDQTKDEALAFVVWDSDRAQELRASVPHSSIKIPDADPEAETRVSIETRFILWSKK